MAVAELVSKGWDFPPSIAIGQDMKCYFRWGTILKMQGIGAIAVVSFPFQKDGENGLPPLTSTLEQP